VERAVRLIRANVTRVEPLVGLDELLAIELVPVP
jgi:hypothetical protein